MRKKHGTVKYGRCLKCGISFGHMNASCRGCKSKIRDAKPWNGHKRRIVFESNGVLGLTCRKCQNHKPDNEFLRFGLVCKKCSSISLRKSNKKRLREMSSKSWAIRLARDVKSLDCKDYIAMGFDCAKSGKVGNPYESGSLMWYFFHEGFQEFFAKPDPFAFKTLPKGEHCNRAGMSGQRVNTFSRRALKWHTGLAKIYADDEFYQEMSYPNQVELHLWLNAPDIPRGDNLRRRF